MLLCDVESQRHCNSQYTCKGMFGIVSQIGIPLCGEQYYDRITPLQSWWCSFCMEKNCNGESIFGRGKVELGFEALPYGGGEFVAAFKLIELTITWLPNHL